MRWSALVTMASVRVGSSAAVFRAIAGAPASRASWAAASAASMSPSTAMIHAPSRAKRSQTARAAGLPAPVISAER